MIRIQPIRQAKEGQRTPKAAELAGPHSPRFGRGFAEWCVPCSLVCLLRPTMLSQSCEQLIPASAEIASGKIGILPWVVRFIFARSIHEAHRCSSQRLSVLAMLGGCGGEKHDQAAQAPPPAQVEEEGGVSLITVDHPDRFPVTTATQYASTSTLNVTGTVNPDVSRTIPVISIASGRVVAIHTQIGAYVKKGQLLMEVQSTDISNAFDQYLKAVNDERLARTQDERAKILYDKGAIAKSQLEIADDAEQDAKTDLTAAEQQLHFLGVDPAHPSLTAKVYSPATGVVIAQNVTNAAATGVTFAGSVHRIHHRRSLPSVDHLRCVRERSAHGPCGPDRRYSPECLSGSRRHRARSARSTPFLTPASAPRRFAFRCLIQTA